MAMTKGDLAVGLCKELGLSHKEALRLTDQFLGVIKETLVNGEPVKISGFGTFTAKKKNSRRGRNPRNGDQIVIAERTALTFKPSPVLKETLNTERK